MSGANISNGTISTTSLGFTFVDMSNAQTIGGAKTFSVAPTMSGANITSGTIPTSAISSGFVDTSTTQTIGGAKTFSTAPVMSGANISTGTISTNSLGFTFVDMSNAQTVGGAKTFSGLTTLTGGLTASAAQTITFGTNAPTMSGANISTGTIPTSAVASGFVDTSTTQTSIGGAKTFTGGVTVSTNPLTISGGLTASAAQTINFGTNAPTMSGANISSGTISTTSLGFTFVDMSNAQTVGGAKTFSVAPTMSGANISTGTIPTSAVASGFVDTSTTQTIGGAKTFSGNVSLNGNVSIGNINLYQMSNISTSTTLSYPLSQTYNITSSSDTTITLPTIASGTSIIGDVINFFKSGSSTILVTIQSISNTDKFITNGTITQATTFTIPSGTTSAMLIACAGTPNYWTAIGGGGSGSTFSNIAINKSSVDAGYILDASGNTKIGGNLVVGNGLTVSSGTISLPSGSIATSAIASGFVDTSSTQNSIGGAKTFTGGVTVSTNPLTVSGGLTASTAQTINFGTNAPTMSGANISSASIPTSAIASGFVDTANTQTIGGAKTFSTAPVMSGANISSASIPTSAVASGFADTSTTQTIGGAKTFSGSHILTGGLTATGVQTITFGTNAPTMSGANISSASIPTSAIASGFVDTSTTQTIGGAKTFSTAPVMSGANITSGTIPTSAVASGFADTSTTQTIGGAKTFSGSHILTGGLTATGVQTITFGTNAPTMSGANISSASIPTSAIASGFVDTSTTQTIGGAKTFSVAPTMSGANIASNSIPASSIIGGGGNSFTTGISVSGVYASTTKALVVTGNASISGNVTAVSYNATSDRRLKANIQPLHSQWNTILNVDPVSFDWTVDGRTDIGFIAQDVYKSYPHLKPNYKTADPSFNEEEPVDLSGNPMYYTLDYGRMTPFLWQGMKEIMQKLDRLETENKKLVERIAVLESK
jgi:hypothetical protein